MKIIKLIGQEAGCDLVIEQPNVGGLHARLELTDEGHVYLLDAGSGLSTYLNRNEQWVRIHKIRLCVADRIRLGEHEVTLAQLVAVFGKRVDIRLGDMNFTQRRHKATHANQRDNSAMGTRLQRPRRNPLNGKIEL